MLITNTPNSELHIFNNEGEEIVTIDGTGVTKPSGGVVSQQVKTDGQHFAFYRIGEFTQEDGDYVVSQEDLVAFNEWVKSLSQGAILSIVHDNEDESRVYTTVHNILVMRVEFVSSGSPLDVYDFVVTCLGNTDLSFIVFDDEPTVLYYGIDIGD